MSFWKKFRGWVSRKQQDQQELEQLQEKQAARKPVRIKPTCAIHAHKNRRYDGTLRGSIDATKLGVTL